MAREPRYRWMLQKENHNDDVRTGKSGLRFCLIFFVLFWLGTCESPMRIRRNTLGLLTSPAGRLMCSRALRWADSTRT